MNIVILGGTRFVGRHIADALAARGHQVTLFNRGTNPSVHADLEQVHGDRVHDLNMLDGRTWDAVVDTSAYTPAVAETAARYFADRTARYVFISTISVYDTNHSEGPDEDSPLLELPGGADPNEYSDENYGALKVLCERQVQRAFGQRSTILRPGLVAGPFDHTDRFTYWPVRCDEGGEVLAPPATRPIQYVDARDLAAFCAHVCERDIAGIFNCIVPRGTFRFGDLLTACLHESSPEDAFVVNMDDEWLVRHDVQPWKDLPLWVPPQWERIVNADSARATANGFTVRPLPETVRDTLAWARGVEKRPGAMEAGLSPEREAELLAAAAAERLSEAP